MNILLLIGITGYKHSGKDEVAKSIRQHYYPTVVKRIAFADALKSEVALGCGITVDYLEKNKEAFRLILQGWGTDYRRKLCNENYWIERWCSKLLQISENSIVVVPDVRFKNEFQAIKHIGGHVIRVTRPSDILVTDTHPSERDLDDVKVDFIIENNGSLGALHEKVTQLCTNHLAVKR